MRRIYLVRHGETVLNSANLIQDHTDQLSQVGYAQARLVAQRFRDIHFDVLYSSDYIRAKATADEIAQATDKKIITSPIFREVKRPSSLVGAERSSIDYYNFFKISDEHIADPSWRYEDEENFHDVMERVWEAFAIFDTVKGDILVVTHGRFLIFLVMYVLTNGELNAGIWKLVAHGISTSHTGITIFEYDDQFSHWRLKTFNDIAHFAE